MGDDFLLADDRRGGFRAGLGLADPARTGLILVADDLQARRADALHRGELADRRGLADDLGDSPRHFRGDVIAAIRVRAHRERLMFKLGQARGFALAQIEPDRVRVGGRFRARKIRSRARPPHGGLETIEAAVIGGAELIERLALLLDQCFDCIHFHS